MHLVKLCVGIASPDELLAFRAKRRALGLGRADGMNYHRTRMMPRRADEVAGAGSLYWVMSGMIRCRQRVVALEPGVDGDGRGFCDIVMDPELILTAPRPKRPFQGWRYLTEADAPSDLPPGASEGDESLGQELARMGLI